MCDIYEAKCSNPRCSRVTSMHLADWAIPRESVEVFCYKHLPKTDVAIHTATEKQFLLRTGSIWGVRFRESIPEGYDYEAFGPNWGIRETVKVLGNPVVGQGE